MQRKDRIDTFGAISLVGSAPILGLNRVVIKVVNDGLQPVFAAGARWACCPWPDPDQSTRADQT